MRVSSGWLDPQRALFFLLVCRFFHLLFGAVWFYNRLPLGPNVAGITLLL